MPNISAIGRSRHQLAFSSGVWPAASRCGALRAGSSSRALSRNSGLRAARLSASEFQEIAATKARQHGPPLSTSRSCQPERTEIWRPNPWPLTRTLGVRAGPRRSVSQNGDSRRNKYLRNVWDMGAAQMRSCQAKPLCWLDLRDVGSPKT